MAVWSTISKSRLEGTTRIDAEYYQSSFIKQIAKIKSHSVLKLGKIAKSIKKGIFDIKAETYLSKGVPFIRISNLKNGLIDSTGLVCISPDMNDREKKTSLSNRDIVLSKTAYPAASMITFNKCNISQDIIGIRIKKDALEKVIPGYVVVFLNTTYGLNQMERWFQGNIQRHLALPDAKEIMIPLAGIEFQKDMEKALLNVEELQMSSVRLYAQAEQMLLGELDMKDLGLSHELFYTANLNDTKQVHRIDAEYYQPKYDYLLKKLQRFRVQGLGQLVSLKKGIEPGSEAYQESGIPFIRVSNLSKYGINLDDPKFLSDELYDRFKDNYQPKKDEILLTKDATPGVAYVLEEEIKGIIAGGIVRLRVKADVEKQYLALVINSVVGRAQSERDGGGSVITHWKPAQIKSLLIPIINKSAQKKIADLVTQSHQARQRAKELLTQAKKQVEDLIEKGE